MTVILANEEYERLISELNQLKTENKALKKQNDELQVALDAYDREHISW